MPARTAPSRWNAPRARSAGYPAGEHEHVLEAVQRRLDEHPEKMRQRRKTVEHPFGTIESWMGSTHFQTKTLKRVGTENGLARAGRQSQTRHEHHGPADRGDARGIGARQPRHASRSSRIAAHNRKPRPLSSHQPSKSENHKIRPTPPHKPETSQSQALGLRFSHSLSHQRTVTTVPDEPRNDRVQNNTDFAKDVLWPGLSRPRRPPFRPGEVLGAVIHAQASFYRVAEPRFGTVR